MPRRFLIPAAVAVALLALWARSGGEDTDEADTAELTQADEAPRPRIRRPVRLAPRDAGDDAEEEDTGEPAIAEWLPAEEEAADTGEALPPPLVRVLLVDTDGEPIFDGAVTSPDCGVWRPVDFDGIAEFWVQPGLCMFQGRRRDGLLWARSSWLEVDLIEGDEVELELVIPTERTGGLGVQIQQHDEGVEVVRVWPGTPAADMGLQAGDVITAVDGLPASALTMDEFIEVMTGPEGTEVEFELSYDGDTGLLFDTMTLTRAWLNN